MRHAPARRLPLLALLLISACAGPRVGDPATVPGGQVRWRPDPLAGAERVPWATAPAATPLALDGVLDDPSWTAAAWHADGVFAACHDPDNLYLAVRSTAAGPDRQATGPGEARDQAIEAGDLVAIRLAPQDRQEMFIDLLVAPDATVADRQMTWTPDGIGRYYAGFTLGGLRTASRVVRGAWTVEVAIPWTAMWAARPRPGSSLRLQVGTHAAGSMAWRTWAPGSGLLDEPPTRFGVLGLGAETAPWRVLRGELLAGPEGRLLALSLTRLPAAPAEAEILVSGNLAGQATVSLMAVTGRVAVPVRPVDQGQRADGYRRFEVQVRVDGRSWPLGGWHLRDPLANEAGAMVVAGVGGEAAGLPLANAGLGLAAMAIPAGRAAVDLRIQPMADGAGPWRLVVAEDGTVLADLAIPGLPAVAAIPTAGLAPGAHRLAASLRDAAGLTLTSATLPLEVVP